MASIAIQLRALGLTYLETASSGAINDEQWEQVNVQNGHLTVHPSPEATAAVTWQNLFDQLFIQGGSELRLQQADDLLFFVRKGSYGDRESKIFVRRKGKQMPTDCAPGGKESSAVDWPASTLLNLALQTPFYLTVSSCRTSSLHQVLEYGQRHADISQVTQHVFASPTRVDVNLDSSRTGHSEPEITYPNLCFAVDNFDCAFESMVLQHQDDCYAVCLWGLPPLPPDTGPKQSAPSESIDALTEQLQHTQIATAGSASSLAASSQQEDLQSQRESASTAETLPSHWSVTETAAQPQPGGEEKGVAGTDRRTDRRTDPKKGVAGTARQTDSEKGFAGTNRRTDSAAGSATRMGTGGTDRRTDTETQQDGARRSFSATESTPKALSGNTEGHLLAGAPLGDPLGVLGGPSVADTGQSSAAASAVGRNSAMSADGPGRGAPQGAGAAKAPSKPSAVLLFAGYVPFDKLQTVVDTTGLHPMRLWTKSSESQQRVRMKGPGGLGHADVAVTVGNPSVADARPMHHDEDGGPAATMLQLKRGLFNSAAKLAGAAAKAAKGIAAGPGQGPPHPSPHSPTPVRCALMTLTLPVDEVARKLLQGPAAAPEH